MNNKIYLTEGTAALQGYYMVDIPWEKAPAFVKSIEKNQDIAVYKEFAEKNPISQNRLSFTSSVWDFSPFYNLYKPHCTCSFEKLPSELSDTCKFFVLQNLLMQRQKLNTILQRYNTFRSIYLHIVQEDETKHIGNITTSDISNEVSRRNVAVGSAHSLYESAYQVFNFLKNVCKMDISVDVDAIKTLSLKCKHINSTLDTKLSNIPEEYFNIIYNKSIEIMRDVTADIDMRMTASALLLLSQTGLRLSEILALTTDRLKTKKLNNGFEASYIHYVSLKSSRPNEPLREFDIPCTKIAAEAFNTMIELRNNIAAENKRDTLFVLSTPKKNVLPYSLDVFHRAYYRFMQNYLLTECTTEWKGIAPRKPWRIKSDKLFYIPDTRQYRVHYCTTLYQKNISLKYIQKFMGHVSDCMLGYYARPKDNYQENIEYTGKVITEMVEEDLTPLGGKLIGDKIKKEIQKFVEENKLNVEDDIYGVIKALGKKVVIRGKRGGVCIKTILESCKDDVYTDKLMCAHSLCPNLFHFYYMLDITYADFQTMQNNYFFMKEEGLKQAVEKELGKIKDLITRRLLPELDELEKELEKKGYDAIVARHPELIEIIEKNSDIRKEDEEWLTKN